jgi:hypothetical protein
MVETMYSKHNLSYNAKYLHIHIYGFITAVENIFLILPNVLILEFSLE